MGNHMISCTGLKMKFHLVAVVVLAVALGNCHGGVVQKRNILNMTGDAIKSAVDRIGISNIVNHAVAWVGSFFAGASGQLPLAELGVTLNYKIDACKLNFGKRAFIGSILDGIKDIGNTIGDGINTVGDKIVPKKSCKASVSEPQTGISASASAGDQKDALEKAIKLWVEKLIAAMG